MKWNIDLIIIMLLLVSAVSAQIVPGESQRIDMQECGFVTTGIVSCGQSAVVSCDVVDYTSSDYGVNTVTFTVNGQKYVVNDQNTGTPQNGTWVLVLDIDENTADEVTVTTVSAQNSIGTTCSSEDAADIDACLVRWNSNPRNISIDCECTWSTTEEKFIDNTCIITHTPSVGCEDEEYTTNTYCDYCDPEWIVSLDECIPNREEVDPFYGVSKRRYTAADGLNACCSATGLVSDCTPPADAGTDVVCRLDSWSGDGKNTYGTKTNNDQRLYESPVELSQAFTVETIPAVPENGQLERALKPVAFDFNIDGEMEIVYFKANGFVSYDTSFDVQQTVTTSDVAWQGQPGLFGFNDVYHRALASDLELTKTWLWSGDNYNQAGLCVSYDGQLAPNACTLCGAQSTPYHEQVCCNVNPECLWNASNPAPTDLGRGFAGIIKDSSGDDHFVAYQSISGSFVKLTDINLQSTASTAAPGSGVACWLDHCFFMDENQYMWKVDVDDGTYIRKNVHPDANVETRPVDSVPVFVHSSSTGLVSGVVVETWSSTPSQGIGPGLAVCNIALTSCSVSLIGPSVDASISRLVAYPYDNSLPGTPIVFTLYDDVYGDGSLLEQYLYRFVVTPALVFTNPGYKKLEGTGGAASCITDPALGRCDSLGDYNVVVAPHFEKETSTIVTLPDAPWQWTEDVDVTIPLSTPSFTGLTAVARSTCSGDLCVLMSGTPTTNVTDYSAVLLYYSVNNGPYTSVVKPSGFLNPGMIIRYAGAMNGKVYFLTGVASGDTYINFDLWRLDGDGVLTKLADLTGGASAAGGNTYMYGESMLCAPERCWVPITRGELGDDVHIFEIMADETWEVHQPVTGVSIGPYTFGYDNGAPSLVTANPEGVTEIYGYAKTDVARYYAFGSPLPRGNGGGSWPGYLVRVPITNPAGFSILASSSTDFDTYMGLHADPSGVDEVWFGVIPDSTSCTFNSTKYNVHPGAPVLRGVEAGIDIGDNAIYSNSTWYNSIVGRDNCFSYTPYNTASHARICAWELFSSSNGGLTLESRQTVDMHAGAVPPCGGGSTKYSAVGPVRTFGSTGGIDASGDNYVNFYFGVNSLSGDNAYTGITTFYSAPTWNIIMKDGKVFYPQTVQYASLAGNHIGRVWNYGADAGHQFEPTCTTGIDDECIIGSCCIPMTHISQLYPFSTADFFSRWQTSALFNSYYQFGNTIRGVFLGNNVKVDQLTSGGVETIDGDYTYYSCYSPNYASVTNGFTELQNVIASEEICPSSIVTVDLDVDNIDEVMSISGAYKYGSNRILTPDTAVTSIGVVASFDLNADTYVDFSLVSTQLLHIISAPEIAIAQGIDGEGTSVASCSATFDTVNSLVSVIPVGVSAENPTFLRYSAKLLSTVGAGTIDTASGSTPSLSLRPLVGGQYDVQYTVTDEYKESQCVLVNGTCLAAATVTCSVNVPQSAIAAPTTTSSCSLEPDGEFNYNDILGSDWFIIYGSGADTPVMVDNEFVSLDDAEVKMAHLMDCSDESMLVEMRLRGVSSDTSILIVAESSSNDNTYQIGGVRLLGTELQAYGPDGAVTFVDLTAIGGWDAERFFTASMIFDFATQQYVVYVEGVSLLTIDFSNDVQGKVIAVEVDHQEGFTHIDYIRTGGQTGVDRVILSEDDNNRQYAFQALNTCLNASDRDWGENPAGEYQVYPNIESYCDRRGEGTGEKFCGQLDLIDAVHYNPGCYWEANNYCQYVTFPRTGGMLDDDVAVRGGAGSLSGVMACTALLGTGATWSIVAEPTVSAMWTVFTNNLMVFLLIIGVIIILIPVFARRKR